MLKTKDAAAYIGVSKSKLRTMVQDGKIPAIIDETPWLFDRADLDKWIESSKVRL